MPLTSTPAFGSSAPPPVFTTWNPADKGTNTVLSNGDLTATMSNGASYSAVRSVVGVTSGQQKIWEITIDSLGTGTATVIGAGTSAADINNYPGQNTASIGYQTEDGTLLYNNGALQTSLTSLGATDVLTIEFDIAINTWYFYVNGVFETSQVQALAGGGSVFPMLSNGNFAATGQQFTANFGASAFVTTPQSGFTGISS